MKKIVVVGGGAAGLAAAVFASERAKVVLLEKNDKLGKKIYITGKGRCNLTNTVENGEFLKNVVTNGKFLYSALNFFPSSRCCSFFEENGLKLKVERGGRVFPESDKASDVTAVLARILEKNRVDIRLNNRVKAVRAAGDRIESVLTEEGEIECDALIFATGGCAYPSTGSNGEGFTLIKSLGHRIVEPQPSLVGLQSSGIITPGLTLKNIGATLIINNKKIAREFGELLFTHGGISGPVVLTLSSRLPAFTRNNGGMFFKENSAEISIDFKPALSVLELEARVLKDFNAHLNKYFINALDGLLPQSIIPEIVFKSQIDGNKKINAVTSRERKGLVRLLKDYRVKIEGTEGFESAVITSGGVVVSEISPSSMCSKLFGNLYFCGEIIDVDALTGGYNLQIAFSTGALAGFKASL